MQDLKSGFLIFLIALPLCLGISMASGFPPVSGLITAVVGALVSSFLGSSPLTIKGPAAGLIGVVLAATQELGAGDLAVGYRRVLAVGVIAAIMQLVIAWRRGASIGALVPPAVVHGMLAAIGIIIISKQIHIMLGVAPHAKEPLRLISEIPASLVHANPRITLLGLITFIFLFLNPLRLVKPLQSVPAAVVALAFVVPLSVLWHLDSMHSYAFAGHTYTVGPSFLVSIPANIRDSLAFPDFTVLTTLAAWKYVIMLALIASIESTLTVTAVDALDPKKRVSNLDKDLMAAGFGNLISSLCGGLPMISEIVRSKANIDNGAQSHLSNFYHGVFLFAAVALIPGLLHEIPLSALAAMLIFTGLRLSSPKEFLKAYEVGWDQLFLFLATVIVTLATDLLVGVATGIALKLVLHFMRGVRPGNFFRLAMEVSGGPSAVTIAVKSPALFTNFMSLRRSLEEHAKSARKVIIDVSKAPLVDHTTLEKLQGIKREFPKTEIQVTGFDALKGVTSHELSAKRRIAGA